MAGTYLKIADNAESTLNGAISAIATTIAVTSSASYPSAFPYMLTIWDEDTYPNPTDDSSMEQVLVTGASTNDLTVTRGYGDTIGVTHATGESISLLVTSAVLDDATYGIEAILDTHLDNSPVHLGIDTVKDTHIDWGTGASQVSAGDIPIADAGSKITATDVDAALTENRTAINLNSAKNTNATHTGDVTGSAALSIDKTAVTGKAVVTAVGTDYVLIADTSDTGALKKSLISDFASAGGDMSAATYDPLAVAGDAFDMDNMTEGTTTKVLSATERTAISTNTAKDTNVSTNLSEGTSTETTVDVNSSDGNNATLVAASTSRAGLLTKAKFDEIVANTAKTGITDEISNIIEDTTPQLGGALDTNSKQIRMSKGADVASGTALTLGADGNYFDITGTTTITSIGTLAIGTVATLHFDGVLILTHHATDLILPSAANITTAAGDEATFVEYATGDWRCVSYSRADGIALVGGAGDVSKVGTPVDNQIGVWTGDGTLEGDANLTFDTSTDTLDVGGDITVGGTVDGVDIGLNVVQHQLNNKAVIDMTNAANWIWIHDTVNDEVTFSLVRLGTTDWRAVIPVSGVSKYLLYHVETGDIDDNAVTNAKAAQIATATIKGRVTAATGNVEDLTAANVRTIINVADGAIANLVEDTTPQLGGPLDSNSKQIRMSKGADVASGTALTLGADGNYFDIIGTTTITSIGTLAVGTVATLHFDGILILTHHSTDLILPSGANITTAAGDEATFIEYAIGDWRCISYTRADGTALVGGSGGSSGGLYGINVETLSADKTLTSGTDKIYQYLDEGGANRIITLDTASATTGDRWVIRHNGDYADNHYLNIMQGGTNLDYQKAGKINCFIFDGTNWVASENGSAEADNKKYNVSIGRNTSSYSSGTAIGYSASGGLTGVGIGRGANGWTSGVAVGYSADGNTYGTALGHTAKTNANRFAIALGYAAECERYSEIAHNINGLDSDQENNITIGGFEISTANATPTEMLCGGQSAQRFTIRASSVLAFRLIVTARDNIAGHVGMWTVANGVIKRDAANNTVMATAATVTEVVNESTDWSVAVTADDTNEALIITVTGDATNPVQWAARLDGVETHF